MFKRTAKALGSIKDRQKKLADAIADLERDMRLHKVEMLGIYDKIHRLFGRIAKRQAIDYPSPGPDPAQADAGVEAVDEISAAIHARRAKGKAT